MTYAFHALQSKIKESNVISWHNSLVKIDMILIWFDITITYKWPNLESNAYECTLLIDLEFIQKKTELMTYMRKCFEFFPCYRKKMKIYSQVESSHHLK